MIAMHFLWRRVPGRRVLGRRVVSLVALLLVPALLIAACDGDDDDGATATPAMTSTATPEPTPTAAPTEAPPTDTPAPEPAAALEVSLAEDGELGSYLVGPEGLTLYIFLVDEPDVTNCFDDCLAAWPPLLLEDGQEVEADGALAGEFGAIDRDEGRQVTYMGAPLYYWASDTAPGDTTGHGVGDVWFVARPDTASTAIVNVRTEGDLAPFLVGPDGLTLYLFTNDEPNVSNCSGGCADNWPPLTVPDGMDPSAVEAAPGELGIIERDDDLGRQVTYDGILLYYWAADVLPGDTTGEGVGGVWFVVPPEAADPAAATGPAPSAPAPDDSSEDEPYTY
jgi:predicted lipoprotein with Yx(FWY)xxD motif